MKEPYEFPCMDDCLDNFGYGYNQPWGGDDDEEPEEEDEDIDEEDI